MGSSGLPTTLFEMYDNGHNAMWMVGHQATTRQDFHSGEVPAMNFQFHGMGASAGRHSANWKQRRVVA